MAEASISGSLTRDDVTDVAGFFNAASVLKAAGQCQLRTADFGYAFSLQSVLIRKIAKAVRSPVGVGRMIDPQHQT